MPRFSILPDADRDVDEQTGYLGDHASFETALRFHDAAYQTFAFLARNPGVGAIRESRNPRLAGIRVWRVDGFANHLVFCRPVEGGIEVVRVLHGRRDIDRLMDFEDR